MILIGTMSLCHGGILSDDLTVPIVAFCSQFMCKLGIYHPFVYNNSSLCPKHMKEKTSFDIYAKKISISGSLSQVTKLWVNLNSAICKCRAVIPRAVIDELMAVFNLAVVGCIGVLKLSSMF